MTYAYCDGYGTMVCHCGGDLCVCGTDGEDCFGCEKCAHLEDDDSDDLMPPGHIEKLTGAVKNAPKLPDDEPGDFPEPPI